MHRSVSTTKHATSQDHQAKLFGATAHECHSLSCKGYTDTSTCDSSTSTRSKSLSSEGIFDGCDKDDSGFCYSGCSESCSQEENEIVAESAGRDALRFKLNSSSDKVGLGPPPGFDSTFCSRLLTGG